MPGGSFVTIECDLQDFASVRKAAGEVKARYERIYCLANNGLGRGFGRYDDLLVEPAVVVGSTALARALISPRYQKVEAGSNVVVFAPAEGGKLSASWGAVKGAVSYRFEVSRDAKRATRAIQPRPT